MAFKLIPWLASNEFVHIRSFLNPLLDHESVPPRLCKRIRKRIKSGIRLYNVRVGIYAVMFPAVLAVFGSLVFIALEEVVAEDQIAGLERLFSLILQIMSLLFIVAVVALFVVQRAMRLVLVDLNMLAMEAVALGVKGGAPAPSTQYVRMKKKKSKEVRSAEQRRRKSIWPWGKSK